MKNYIVIFETNEEIKSTFEVKANNLKEARGFARLNKMFPFEKCRTRVYVKR